ncbi:branched-chain amino acid ABC transporter permease [Halobacteriales archaeon QS_1_67_19]|nr:MAG: branched-chain amino acid ABC transporter permease [Halobacteriales archaeon QS_1_67_19]
MGAADRLERFDPAALPVSAELAGTGLVAIALLLLAAPVAVPLPAWALIFLEVTVTFLLYGLLVLGLNLQFGFAGLVNFGHVAFFAVGGYAAAMLTASDPFAGVGLGLPWPVGLVAAIGAAALLGAVIGLATLRLRDDFLAIATLAVAEILHDLLGSFESITGADIGILGVPRPIAALSPDSDTATAVTVVLLAGVLLLGYAAVERLTDAPYGRVLRAIRADERVAASLGKPVFDYKLQAFVVGAALAGLAGALFAFYNGAVAPGFFGLNVTVLVWIGMLIGGAAHNRGVLAGLAVVLGLRLVTRFLNEQLPFVTQDQFASVRLVVIGLVLIAIVRYRPAGIWGTPEELTVDQ